MNNLMTKMCRQGDVLICRVDEIPAMAKEQKRDRGRVVLAYGESTGHAHAFHGSRVTLYADTGSGSGGRRFLRVTGDAPEALTHEEHSPILVPPGEYEVLGQREYIAPELTRAVVD